MTTKNKRIYGTAITATLFLLVLVAVVLIRYENNSVIGVQKMPLETYRQMDTSKRSDILTEFTFNGIPAAVDNSTRTIYISQNVSGNYTAKDMEGVLQCADSSLRLKLVEDENFDALHTAVADNVGLKLLVFASDGRYDEYVVVISSLPIMNISGGIYAADDEGDDLFAGEMSFWDGYDEEYSGYKTEHCYMEWHQRGTSSANKDKKPWKLSAKDADGKNKNISLCGLGSDDDWLLSAMARDDLDIREKFIMDLCGEVSAATNGEVLSSRAEYVELVLNGEYQGLYIIMRRIDEKYLGLDDDILLKGATSYIDDITLDTYGRIYAPYTKEQTDSFLAENFVDGYIDKIDRENFVKISLLMQYCCLFDNTGTKNIFFVLQNPYTDYKVKMLLWDVDMSFGIHYRNAFLYRYDYAVSAFCKRDEYRELAAAYPELETELAQTWFRLRQTVFDTDKIKADIDSHYNVIAQSGAYKRDLDKWGLYYHGQDTFESLYSFVEQRGSYLDNFYSQYI